MRPNTACVSLCEIVVGGDRGVCVCVHVRVHTSWWLSEQKLAKLKNRPSRTEWKDDDKMGNRGRIHIHTHTHK